MTVKKARSGSPQRFNIVIVNFPNFHITVAAASRANRYAAAESTSSSAKHCSFKSAGQGHPFLAQE